MAHAAAQEAVDPAAVLNRLVGTWKTETTVKADGNETKISGQVSCKLILNDKFVEETDLSKGDGADHRVLWGYEPGKKVFRL